MNNSGNGEGGSAQPREKAVRLHYLDWLRALATLGVFLYHAVLPFTVLAFPIKNADQTMLITIFGIFLSTWGMPLFFLLAGTGSRFALRRRTGRQYIAERTKRLLIPLIVGVILLTPIQVYLEALHEGWYEGSFLKFGPALIDSRAGPGLHELFSAPVSTYAELLNPRVFNSYGLHLWFLGFLFVYSAVALPLFLWLKKGRGERFISWLGGLGDRRGGLLLFVVPLVLARYTLQPFFPGDRNWADFLYYLLFFLSGYILYADQRFARAIRRDGRLMLTIGIVSTLTIFGLGGAGIGLEWTESPGTPGFYLAWGIAGLNGWCWVISLLYVGMRYLDSRSKGLEYGQEAMLPFYLLHQPVIIAIAFYVVRWQASILAKALVIVLSSFVVTLGLTEALRRIKPVRVLLGMKPRRREMPSADTGQSIQPT